MTRIFSTCALLAALFVAGCTEQDAGNKADSASPQALPTHLLVGEMAGLTPAAVDAPVTDLTFSDAEGRTMQLSEFRGRVLLVNLWATWCPPCVKELPALLRLQERLADAPFQLVPISLDRGGSYQTDKFFAREGLADVETWFDSEMRTPGVLGSNGLPLSVIYDARGREIARYEGDLEWDSPEAVALIEWVIEKGTD